MKRVFFAVWLLCMVFSCSVDPASDHFSGVVKDPLKNVVPTDIVVKSITFASEIRVSWSAHEQADTYRLYRSLDAISDAVLVYQGNDVKFIDTTVIDDTFYYYQLQYVKDEFKSMMSDSFCGVASGLSGDGFEPNETVDSASTVIPGVTATIFYYKDSQGNVIADTDWYYITLPARTKVDVSVMVTSGIDVENLVVTGNDDSSLVVERVIWLENNDNDEKRCAFSVSLDAAGGDAQCGEYTLSTGTIVEF